MAIRHYFRQLLFPREFRIEAPSWPPALAERLAKALEAASQAARDAVRAEAQSTRESAVTGTTQPPPGSASACTDRTAFLADLATGLWRMRRTMVPTGTIRLLEARPIEAVRKPFRWLVSIWDMLKENGLEIQDHTGDRYISGQAIKAQAFEPAPGLKEETVIDTIKPSIYLDGRMIQMGEVVVGTPEGATVLPPQAGPDEKQGNQQKTNTP